MAFSYIFRFKNSAMYDKNMRETFCNKFAGSRKDVNMKNLRFDDLYSPEYYMDVPGNDGRIAIKKFNDARDTMAMAHFSLSYIEDCKLRSNGMPVPLLRNGYSIFNGTKYR